MRHDAATTAGRGPRLLAAGARSHAEHLHRVGPMPDLSAAALLREIQDSGLSGRGGAAFPAAVKVQTVARTGGGVVVANGAEGEPASSKDRWLLANAPHLVLDGLALVARAVAARDAYLYAPDDLLGTVLHAALRERRDRVGVRPVASPDTFISGQETAVVSVINGGRAVPTTAPPAVFQRGVAGRPTLVQNVETLAHIALLARYGAGWFRAAGTSEEPGTRLVTLSGSVRRPGVYETAGDATLGDVVQLAGGILEPVSGLLVGGYHGGWVPWTPAHSALGYTRAALSRFEAAPGAGVVIALPAHRCPLQASAEITTYLAGQNAGQCGPCLNGLPTIADLLTRLGDGRADATSVTALHRVVGLVDGRGACQHPGGTARLVRSTLRAFDADVRAHLSGHCLSGHQLRRGSW